ncbi:SpoIIIAH-like family protein [Blautia liquoris]|nr:SpoIIIAH-like family protein [Blautia liquoris]
MKKKLFKKNQIIITALAVMIAVAGYINYADKNLSQKGKEATAKTEDAKAEKDDTVLKDIESLDTDITDVTAENAAPEENKTDEAKPEDAADNPDADAATDTPGEAVLTGANTYLAQARLDREQTRSQNKETLLSIINNTQLSEDERQGAIKSMVDMTDAVEKEGAAELLLEAKGFEDVVVNMTGETVDVVVPQNNLGDDQRAQIEDIVKRKTGTQPENIVITPID